MDSETIHIHNQNNFDRSRLLILMIPTLAFLVALVAFITLSSYKSPVAITSEDSNAVLGTSN